MHRERTFLYQRSQRLDKNMRLCKVCSYVQPRLDDLADSVLVGSGDMMLGKKIFHCLAVGYYITVKPKLLSQQLGQEKVAPGDRYPIPIVIATHHPHDLCLFYHTPERIEIHLIKFRRRHMRVCPG